MISIDSLFSIAFDTSILLQTLSVAEVELEPVTIPRTTFPFDVLFLPLGSVGSLQVLPSLCGRGRSGPGTQGPWYEWEPRLVDK